MAFRTVVTNYLTRLGSSHTFLRFGSVSWAHARTCPNNHITRTDFERNHSITFRNESTQVAHWLGGLLFAQDLGEITDSSFDGNLLLISSSFSHTFLNRFLITRQYFCLCFFLDFNRFWSIINRSHWFQHASIRTLWFQRDFVVVDWLCFAFVLPFVRRLKCADFQLQCYATLPYRLCTH